MASKPVRPTLRDLEAQFYAVVAARAAPGDLEVNIVGDDRLSAVERLELYADMYLLRLRDVLRGDFPKVHAIVGDEAFDDLVVAYLRASPPVHPSIRNAGERLPAFLAAHEHPWLAELAALERAHLEVFDGPDTTPLEIDRLRQLRPDEFANLPLRLIASSILLRVRFAIDELWQILDEGRRAPSVASASPRTLLIWRQDLAVYHRAVSGLEAHMLKQVAAEETATFGTICEFLSETSCATDVARLAYGILAGWVSDGLLAG